jgi:L-cysteine:1D-myo-inositol 2-amino-2-deoxy-alpha-D-glucopyranoside ligase
VTLRLYNSLSGAIEDFRPDGDVVRMYVCGVTPYDTTHLGHAFCYVAFDVLSRYLRHRGYHVRYIQNITDIDNDILRKAKELDEPWDELGNRNILIHQRSLDALGVEPPEKWTRATEEVPMMVEMIEGLINQGYAYEREGNVYFRVARFPEYGRLSKVPRDRMPALLTETGDPADDPRKEAPVDFLLWQAAKPGEPTWRSPWGPGRPGWHIECSAMAIRYLGEQLDIHGGGGDLRYPHHESEIAQSEAWSGQRPFARIWMHVGMLMMDGEKMSKSLGNMVFVGDLLKEYPPEAIRLYLSSVRYRDVLEWSPGALGEAVELLGLLRRAAGVRHPVHPGGAGAEPVGRGEPLDAAPFREAFVGAMDDDLDTGTAIGQLRALAEAIEAARDAGRPVETAREELRTLGEILGLVLPAV